VIIDGKRKKKHILVHILSDVMRGRIEELALGSRAWVPRHPKVPSQCYKTHAPVDAWGPTPRLAGGWVWLMKEKQFSNPISWKKKCSVLW
jgi:hypothetical protein